MCIAADRGQQAVAADGMLQTHVHQQETACAVGILGLAGFPATLAVKSRLLVTRDAGNRDAVGYALDPVGFSKYAGAGKNLGQHGGRNVQNFAQFLDPSPDRGCRTAACAKHWSGPCGAVRRP